MKLTPDIQLDSAQQAVADILQKLELALSQVTQLSMKQKLSRIIKKTQQENIKGVYIHGSVGRGKTMLMDAFYTNIALVHKQRWHFHAFMQQVHQRLKAIRLGEGMSVVEDQPVDILAQEIANKARLLCFDEFHVTDIADAMILGRLFGKMFQLGVVVVTTSNQHPDELYANGLHRERFLPFIEILKEYAPEIELDGPIDYRRAILQQHKRYFTPISAATIQEIDTIFEQLTAGHKVESYELRVNGRILSVPKASNGVARLSYPQLCEQPLGPADYLCLADNFHTVLLENIPVMDETMYNEAKRFMTLIDILYDRNIHLIVSAQNPPDQLYFSRKNKEMFLRTASRLIEMTGG